MGAHEQTGLAACFSIDEYDRDIIKKHERTRRDKEDDRTRHMLALGAQTGPVFLTYRASAEVDRDRRRESRPARRSIDFAAPDGVRHTLWRVERRAIATRSSAAFVRVPALYIADGHHRAASAARARADIRDRAITRTSLGDDADYTTFLAVAFPHDQVQILAVQPDREGSRRPHARGVPAGGRASGSRSRPGPATPARRGDIAMYVAGRLAHAPAARRCPTQSDAIGSLDVSVLQEQLLAPVLKIADVRTDKRIDFVGGARGTSELEKLVDSRQGRRRLLAVSR